MTPPKNVKPFVVAQAGVLNGHPTISAGAGARAEKNNWFAQGEARVGNELAFDINAGKKIPLSSKCAVNLGARGSFRGLFGDNSVGTTSLSINNNGNKLSVMTKDCDTPEIRAAFAPSFEYKNKNWKASLGLELGYKNNEEMHNTIVQNKNYNDIGVHKNFGGLYKNMTAGLEYTTNNGKMTFGASADRYGGQVTAKINL